MCMTGFCIANSSMTDAGTFTLAGLLQDPLTRMVMLSDGVTEKHFSDLMLHVQGCLIARDALSAGVVQGGPGVSVA
jgi:hypothetical protein